MADGSAIEWTEATWNPTTGCDRVSTGCDHCYAMTLAKRLKAMGSPRYQHDGDPATSGPGFGVTVHPEALVQPLRWRKPRLIFVNSMSDLFHEHVPSEFIADVFAVMSAAHWHTYQVLTKRHARMRSLLSSEDFQQLVADGHVGDDPPARAQLPATQWPMRNVWIGVSAEDQQWANIRIPALMRAPAAVRFVSMEPLLGPISLTKIPSEPRPDWVITGGESGPDARPCDPGWVRDIRDECADLGIAFFHKQWGGRTPKAGGRELDGRVWDDLPQQALA